MKKVPPYAPDELLAKYLVGETSPKETAEVEAWLNQTEENRQYFDEMKASWDALDQINEDELKMVDLAWDSFQRKIEVQETKTQVLFPTWSKIAAVILVLLGSAFVINQWLNEEEISKIPVENLAEKPKSVDLPDGSQIALNTQSTLTYPSKFTKEKREVELKGEAFFDIEPDKEKPFIIHAGPVDVEVLGTSFNVRAFDKEGKILVSVKTGRVKVMYEGKEVILEAGEETSFDKAVDDFEKVESANHNADTWNTGVFEVDEAGLIEVVKAARQYYDIRIDLEDNAIGDCLLAGKFYMNRFSFEEIIEQIQRSHPSVKAERIDNGYIIKGICQ